MAIKTVIRQATAKEIEDAKKKQKERENKPKEK